MDRKSLPLLIMMSVAALLPTSAMAAATAAGPQTDLPGVENESSSATAPVLSPDLVQRNGVALSTTDPAGTAPAKPEIVFKSQEEARDKIRRAYLLQKNDELLKLSQAALAQWPEDPSFDYYREIAENRIKAAGEGDANEPAYKKLREKRRKDAIRAILNETTATAPAGGAVAPAVQTPAVKTAQTPAPATTREAASQAKPQPRTESEPAPARASALDKFKDQLMRPAVMYCIGGIVVLGLIVVVLMRRKSAPAKAESKDKIKLKAASKKAEPKMAEPAVEPAATVFNADDELESLFKPVTAEPARPAPEPAAVTPETASLDALFGSITEQPTAASKPVPEPEPEPELEPDVIQEETVPVLSGPIRLEETPIELPSIEEVPPIVTPVAMPELIMPEPVAVAAEPEHDIIQPISLSLPDEDPFYKGGHDEPKPISLTEDTSDLLSVADQPTAVSDPNAGLRPIMPENLEEPAIQPELASTHGFGDDTTTGLPPTEEDKQYQTISLPDDAEETVISSQGMDDETATAEIDLPTIDTTPSVSVHSDETVALDEDTREIIQDTAVSPAIPERVAAPADGKGGAGEDLFSREFQRGLNDFAGSNWAGAVHHLSIAAALKPASVEVKERLREARRRRKESNGE